MEKKKLPRKSCVEIALTRARQARRRKMNPILIAWVFVAALLSPHSTVARQHLSLTQNDAADDWPMSDYERGYSTSSKPRRERYSTQPSMKRLMRDLRRPAAREDVMQFLLARIDDVALRGWVIEQIREDRINRLAIHVHPGLHDAAVISSWQAELDAENVAADEAIDDTATQKELMRKMAGLIGNDVATKSRMKV